MRVIMTIITFPFFVIGFIVSFVYHEARVGFYAEKALRQYYNDIKE